MEWAHLCFTQKGGSQKENDDRELFCFVPGSFKKTLNFLGRD